MWPKSGWSRAARYLLYRVLRLDSSDDSIAGGVAWGVAVSFTPLLGFHLIIAFLGARFTGYNVITALVGTSVGNPWTFPLIWVFIYTIGSSIIPIAEPLPAMQWHELSLTMVLEHFWPVFLPMLVGGIPISVLSWVGVYYALRRFMPVLRRSYLRRWR